MTPEFKAWPKIPRFNRDITITEKIDGTNAAVVVTEDGGVYAQSRKRIIDVDSDNFGFARWVHENDTDLRGLGVGHHFGEWWGKGIQRGYGLEERRFSLFNVDKWGEERPDCCDVVPVLQRCTMDMVNPVVRWWTEQLRLIGSQAAPYQQAEGIVIYHHAANQCFKVLLEGDELPKGVAA